MGIKRGVRKRREEGSEWGMKGNEAKGKRERKGMGYKREDKERKKGRRGMLNERNRRDILRGGKLIGEANRYNNSKDALGKTREGSRKV